MILLCPACWCILRLEELQMSSSVPAKNVAFVLSLLNRELSRLSGDQLEEVLQMVELEEYRRLAARVETERARVNSPRESRSNRPNE